MIKERGCLISRRTAIGRGGWIAADGSWRIGQRSLAAGSTRAHDASVIAGAGQSSCSGCANPQCEPGSWAGRDGDGDDQERHGTFGVAPQERRSFAAQLGCTGPWHQTLLVHHFHSIRQSELGAGIDAAFWLGLAGLVQLPCQLNLVNFWLPRSKHLGGWTERYSRPIYPSSGNGVKFDAKEVLGRS